MHRVFPRFIPNELTGFDPQGVAVLNTDEHQQQRVNQIEAWKTRIEKLIADGQLPPQ